MSQHASLRIDSVGVKHRNVLKRLERIRKLEKERRWTDASSIYGMPKVKSQKIKVKATKEPKAKEGEEAAAPAAAAGAAKPAAGAKAAAAPAGKAAAPAAGKKPAK